MRHLVLICLATVGLLLGSSGTISARKNPWKKVFQENFNKGKLDTSVWKRTSRGGSDWQNTQSSDPRCLTFRKGCLVLRGIVNDDLKADTAHYLTGGIVSEGLKAFPAPGRYEIKARLHAAQGAWPAIWLLAYDTKNHPWPYGGEIDIMERLNGDSIAYQTVHTPYTLYKKPEEKHGGVGDIDPDDFNVYGVDIMPDSIRMHINGKTTFTYPRVPGLEKDHQYPFLLDQYMLIDMQLGGSWVGKVDPKDLPVEMEIDWVKVYELKETKK